MLKSTSIQRKNIFSLVLKEYDYYGDCSFDMEKIILWV